MNQRLIIIDGKTYKSVDEMPPDIRRQYKEAMRNFDRNNNGTPDPIENANPFADQNKDGVPDVFNAMGLFQPSVGNVVSSTKIIVNGQEFDNLDQLPPELRAKYQQVMGAMDANGSGIPDFVEGMIGMSNQATVQTPNRIVAPDPLRSTPIPVSASIEPESSGSWIWITAGVVLFCGCAVLVAAGAWYSYLR